MDRLICGDVGYGKTEVALRAAFKAAGDGKQVLMLVPTTILAQQHYGTFAERLRDYPFTVDHVSRFRPPAEQRAAIKALRTRAGSTSSSAPTACCRATCAPRTSGCSSSTRSSASASSRRSCCASCKLRVDVIAMARRRSRARCRCRWPGLRDISRDRDAARGPAPGQDLRRRVRRGARQAGDHARARARRPGVLPAQPRRDDRRDRRAAARAVPGRALRGRPRPAGREGSSSSGCSTSCAASADVLVCTSIIESGIDIPQANTLIVERADIFGLAQLYQIRGRVGRSRERAYAYLLYRSAGALTAGGGAAAVGAVATTPSSAPASRSRCATWRSAAPATCSATSSPATWPRSASSCTCRCSTRPCARRPREGAPDEELPEPVRLDVNVDAYVPADYVPYEQAKIDVHRRIAGAREVAELEQPARGARGPLRSACPSRSRTCSRCSRRGSSSARPARGRCQLPRRPARGHADRARRRTAPSACAGAPRGALYESGRSQLLGPRPGGASERFPAVVRAADALLAVVYLKPF